MELKELLEKFSKESKERSEDISRTLYEFNRMLQHREKSREECYQFLYARQMEIEKKYGIDCGFSFLYPEWIFKVEDTYEKHKEVMKKFTEQYKDSLDKCSTYPEYAEKIKEMAKDAEVKTFKKEGSSLREDCKSCVFNLYGTYPCEAVKNKRQGAIDYLNGKVVGCSEWFDEY